MSTYPRRAHVAFVVTLAALIGGMEALLVFGERELSGVLLAVAGIGAAFVARFVSPRNRR